MFFIIYYGAPLAKGLFSSSDPISSGPEDDTLALTKPNIEDM